MHISSLPSTFAAKSTLSHSERVVGESSKTVSDLHDLHAAIMEDADYDDPAHSKKLRETKLKNDDWLYDVVGEGKGASNPTPTRPPKPSSTANNSNTATSTPSKQPSNANPVNASLPDPNSTELAEYERKKVSELAAENLKLKEELRAFDGDFFEQLEDLKYRYSRCVFVVFYE